MMTFSSSRIAAIALTVGAVFGVAGAASANPDYVWMANSYKDDKGRYTATLTHGVPETDDRVFQAICETGGNPSFIPTVIGYDTGKLKAGNRVTLRFTATGKAGRKTHLLSGKVYVPESGEGVYGVRIRPKTNDQLWDLLSVYRTLEYRMRGRAAAKISLKGSSKAIKQFLRDCRGIIGDS